MEYNYTINERKNLSSISICKEVIRKKCINDIILIAYEVSKQLNTYTKKLFKLYKYNKLTELMHRWCWAQYYNPTLLDEVVPYVSNGQYDFTTLIKDINYILEIHLTESDKIIQELKKKIIKRLEYVWIHHGEFLSNKSKFVDEVSIKSDEYSVYLKSPFVEEPIKISTMLYHRLHEKLAKFSNISHTLYNQYIFCLIFRYAYIDSGNQQLAINKDIKDIFHNIGVNFELFGSAINVWSDYYCSLFYDIERYFGSCGNFFNITLKSGIYWANPPYDSEIMTNMANKVIDDITSNHNLCFIVTIPIWDAVTQKCIGKNTVRNLKREDDSRYDDYKAYDLLRFYIKDELVIPKHKMKYFNHRLNKYINASDTYILVIYNSIDSKYATKIDNAVTYILELLNS